MSVSPIPSLKKSLALALGASLAVPTEPEGVETVAVPVRFAAPAFKPDRVAWAVVSVTPGVTRTVTGHRVRQQIDVFTNKAYDPTGALAELAGSEVERLLTERPKGADGGLLPGDGLFTFASVSKLLGFTREEAGPGGATIWHVVLEFVVSAQERRLTGTRF